MSREQVTSNLAIPKVLMAVPQYPYPIVGGLERQSHELSKALLKLGVNVTVISGKFSREQNSIESVEGIKVVRFPWSEKKGIRFFQSAWTIASSMYKLRSTYDVIHVHNISWFGAWVITVGKFLGKPVLSKLPNVGEHGIPWMRSRKLGRWLVAAFKNSAAVIAMSEESVIELQQINYPEGRVFKVTNGVSTGQFYWVENKNSEILKVVFTGRLVPQKGLVDLLNVWPDVVSQSNRMVHLEIYGTGPQEEELLQIVRTLGLEQSVLFCGHVDNVSEVLHRAHVFVLPSYAEGNSNAILEAMAAGLPIISTNVGGTAMMLGDEGAKFVVNPGDQINLKRSLVDILQNDEMRIALGRHMFERVQNYFTIDSIAKCYLDAYMCLKAGQAENISSISAPIFRKSINSNQEI